MRSSTAIVSLVAQQRNQAQIENVSLGLANAALQATVQQLRAENSKLKVEFADPQRLAMRLFHPKIIERCGALFEAGQFEAAILIAGKTVEDEIRRRIGADESTLGVGVIGEAMAGDSPPLRFGNLAAEHEGAQSLFRGFIQWFKNPRSHRFLDCDDRHAAFEVIGFASRLLKMLDQASRTT